jgi:GPH family glycoside/pentoside/hexuronide:cation symporter
MEKLHTPWEKKYNLKRFPWLIIGVIPWLISYFMIYMVPLEWNPVKDPRYNWPVFGWFLTTICIYDTMVTIFDLNIASIYPVKFRGSKERRTTTGMGTIFGITGVVLSAIIPPMFITTGVRETYQTAAMIAVLFGLVFFMFTIPGIWEDKKTREGNKQTREILKREKSKSFFKTAKMALKDRILMSKILMLFGFQVGVVMLQTSAFYIVTYLLDEEANAITYLLGAMLLGAIISVPFWLIIANKINNNKKLTIITASIMLIVFIPMIFITGMIAWIIVLFIFGIALGGQWFCDPPTMADVLDDIAVRTRKREQAIYLGYQVFFIKLGQTTIAITIAIVHVLTGFVGGAPSLKELRAKSPTPDLALFGIRIHAAIVPAIILFITILIFWKFYNLTPDKITANRAKLLELAL